MKFYGSYKHFAVIKINSLLLTELVQSGFDVNQPDSETVTLLHWAAINNRKELIKYFVACGAVVDAIGGDLQSTPLHWATR